MARPLVLTSTRTIGRRLTASSSSLELGVQRRLAPAQHEDVDPAVLPREACVDRRQHLGERHHAGERRRGGGEARGALEVAVVEEVLEQDARVLGLHLGQALGVRGRDRGEVAAAVRRVHLRRRRPLLEVGQDLGRLVVQRADQAVPGAPALQPDPPVALHEPPGEALHLGEGPVGPLLVAQRAEGVDVAVDAVAAQRHPGSGACRRRRVHAATRSRSTPAYAPDRACTAIRTSTSGTVTARKSWGRVRPCQTTSFPRVNSTRNRNAPYAGDVPDEDLTGRQRSVPQPGPDDPEGDEVEDDLVGEGRVQRRAGRCTEAGGGIRVEGDAPAPPGGCTRLLGEQAADPADRHPEGHRGREEVTRAQPVAAEALGDVHAEPGADEPAEDAAVAVEPLLGEGGVAAEVEVLEPGAEPHEDRAARRAPP